MNELQNSFKIQYIRKRKNIYIKGKETLNSNVCAEDSSNQPL